MQIQINNKDVRVTKFKLLKDDETGFTNIL